MIRLNKILNEIATRAMREQQDVPQGWKHIAFGLYQAPDGKKYKRDASGTFQPTGTSGGQPGQAPQAQAPKAQAPKAAPAASPTSQPIPREGHKDPAVHSKIEQELAGLKVNINGERGGFHYDPSSNSYEYDDGEGGFDYYASITPLDNDRFEIAYKNTSYIVDGMDNVKWSLEADARGEGPLGDPNDADEEDDFDDGFADDSLYDDEEDDFDDGFADDSDDDSDLYENKQMRGRISLKKMMVELNEIATRAMREQQDVPQGWKHIAFGLYQAPDGKKYKRDASGTFQPTGTSGGQPGQAPQAQAPKAQAPKAKAPKVADRKYHSVYDDETDDFDDGFDDGRKYHSVYDDETDDFDRGFADDRKSKAQAPKATPPDDKREARRRRARRAAIDLTEDPFDREYLDTLITAAETGNYADWAESMPEAVEIFLHNNDDFDDYFQRAYSEYTDYHKGWKDGASNVHSHYDLARDAIAKPGGGEVGWEMEPEIKEKFKQVFEKFVDNEIATTLKDQEKGKSSTNEARISLKKMMVESMVKENRVNLMKIGALLEKVYPELTKAQNTKLTELFTEVSMLATQMNTIPYTKFNMDAWQLLLLSTNTKLMELKEEVAKVAGNKKNINCAPLLKALDEAIIA
jgi:hypothetical protein